ncbi:MAG TPA: hypothetical protein VGU46_11080 [Acidobacteriaceae bacterium]|nr:hypothetical protein [Acidobacteriaceae bacterium]
MAPKIPKLQSMSCQGKGMPRMWPARRASGMTPAHAMVPNVMTHLFRTIEIGTDK